MNYNNILYVLKYIIYSTVLYLAFRYSPFTSYGVNKSVCITIICILSLVIIDLLLSKQQTTNLTEYFGVEDKPCTTCNTPTAVTTEETNTSNKKCRMVCDNDSSDEAKPLGKPTIQTPSVHANPQTNDTFDGMFYDENPYFNRYNDGYNSRANYDTDAKLREYETNGYKSTYQTTGAKSEYNKSLGDDSRQIKGELIDEMPYSDYNHLPVAAGYKSKDYEYGYSFIPPEKWYPQPVRPPICVTDNRAPVCPSLASGTPIDVKDFNYANRVTGPYKMNTEYIKDKLNSGR